MTERRVALAGPINFRDVGGYETADGRAVAWGQVYRSDSLHHLTAEDGVRLAELGLRSALDFRAHDELDEFGIGGLGELEIEHVHLPTTDRAMHIVRPPDWTPPSSAAGVYLTMMQHGAGAYAAALDILARADRRPTVYFCMAGKDRTGVFSALLLGVLGVPDETIVADYTLTHEVVDALHARIRDRRPDIQDVWDRLPPEMIGAHATTMTELAVLVRDQFGSWRDYARSIGVADATLDALRAQLVA